MQEDKIMVSVAGSVTDLEGNEETVARELHGNAALAAVFTDKGVSIAVDGKISVRNVHTLIRGLQDAFGDTWKMAVELEKFIDFTDKLRERVDEMGAKEGSGDD